MLRIVTLLACFACFAFQAGPSFAQEPTDCDRLTAPEPLPAEADVNAAVAACEAALAAQPGEPRIVYQYALALERAGRVEDALRMYEWAAADGYALAIEAVARLTSDTADAELAWTEAERMALGDSMAGISTAMRRFENELPPDPSDPLTIIAEIGTDPAVITEWVAKHTRLIPYAGSLRGARGVLSDRSGNSLDRALALAALLSAAGEDVRLARASLDGEHARALMELSRAARAELPDFPLQSADQMLATLRASGVAEDVAKTAIDETIAARERVDATLANQMAVLLPLLERATDATADTASVALEKRTLEQLKDHFWVQAKQGDSWVDHDPDAATVGTLAPAEVMAADAVPDQLRHSVTIRVVVEIQALSGRREETLVSWTGITAAQSGDTLVSLSHATGGNEGMSQLVSHGASHQQFLAAVDATSNWTPLLWVNGQVIAEKLFTRDGQVRTIDPNVFTQAGRGTTTVFDAAGELLGVQQEAPSELGVPTAEWIEVELTVPGESPRLERRTVFDLLGPALRGADGSVTPTAAQLRDRTMRLAGYSDILILGANPSRPQLARAMTAAVAETADNLQLLALQPAAPDLGTLPHARQVAWPVRQFALERLAGSDAPAISAPNVFMYHQRLTWSSALRDHAEIDIVFNDVLASNDLFVARLQQGIVDSILEGALLEGAISTANDTVADIAAGKTWTLLEPGDEERLAMLNPDLRERVASDLAAGRVALVSLDGSSRGWWRIEASGTVLGMGADGGGSAMAEVAVLAYNSLAAGVCFYSVGAAIAGQVSAVGAGAICMVAGGIGGTMAAGAVMAGGASAAGVIPAVLISLSAGILGGGVAAGGAASGR